jgi:hypothetical protein
MHISFKKDSNVRLKTLVHNKYTALSDREKIAIVGLLAVAIVAFGTYLSAGVTDSVQAMPNEIVAQSVKKQPVKNSNKLLEAENRKSEVLGNTALQENPFLPPPQYRPKSDSIQQQFESRTASVNAVENYKIVNNRQLSEQKAQAAVRPVLQGIVQGAGQTKAVISYEKNSAAYGVNDFVGLYQVIDITNESVILSGSAGRLVLTLKK